MQEGALNHPLRHVTVLEEAHHLLRKTSTAQSEDGSNMMGKAVEMISNAIAEMRSYGDGFIIADQSPGLLDASVLRNTNTKFIMRLPESGVSGRQRKQLLDTFLAPRVSWRKRLELIVELCPLTMERPLELDRESLAAWMDRIKETNELDRIAEAGDIPMVIAANVRQKGQLEERWRPTALALCGDMPDEGEPQAIRGSAFSLLCGLTENTDEGDAWEEELSQGNQADKLSEVFTIYGWPGRIRLKMAAR